MKYLKTFTLVIVTVLATALTVSATDTQCDMDDAMNCTDNYDMVYKYN